MGTFSDLDEMAASVVRARRSLDGARSQEQLLLSQWTKLHKELESSEVAAEVLDKTAMLLNSLGEERQQEAQLMIEGLVTRGLQEIFDESLSLVISTSVKGKTTTTEFLVRTELGDHNSFETSVLDARGGGLVAVVAFLLRVTILLLTHPEGRRFMVIDESFAHVSADRLPFVSSFLKDLVDETGLQLLLVTHQEELLEQADSVLRFSQKDGKTVIS